MLGSRSAYTPGSPSRKAQRHQNQKSVDNRFLAWLWKTSRLDSYVSSFTRPNGSRCHSPHAPLSPPNSVPFTELGAFSNGKRQSSVNGTEFGQGARGQGREGSPRVRRSPLLVAAALGSVVHLADELLDDVLKEEHAEFKARRVDCACQVHAAPLHTSQHVFKVGVVAQR